MCEAIRDKVCNKLANAFFASLAYIRKIRGEIKVIFYFLPHSIVG